jgi:hypothetical protein
MNRYEAQEQAEAFGRLIDEAFDGNLGFALMKAIYGYGFVTRPLDGRKKEAKAFALAEQKLMAACAEFSQARTELKIAATLAHQDRAATVNAKTNAAMTPKEKRASVNIVAALKGTP